VEPARRNRVGEHHVERLQIEERLRAVDAGQKRAKRRRRRIARRRR